MAWRMLRIRQENRLMVIIVCALCLLYLINVVSRNDSRSRKAANRGYLTKMIDAVWTGNKDKARQKFHQSFNVIKELGTLEERKLKRPLILAYTKYYDIGWSGLDKCPEVCEVTTDKNLFDKADMVLFQGWKRCEYDADADHGVKCYGWDQPDEIWYWPGRQVAGQVWLYDVLESQENTANGEHLKFTDYLFNYTITFKNSSTLSRPYGYTIPVIYQPDRFNYLAKHKSKLALWLVSHCNVETRDAYVDELNQYMNIDEYGKCSGNRDPCYGSSDNTCLADLKKQYKFYIAFENSICEEYVTEKFWRALQDGMVPIVLGANLEFYAKIAPPNSYLHVDNFTSPQQLAEYVLYLDQNDSAYNQYQKWRVDHSIRSNNPRNACEVCRLAAEKPSSVVKLSEWWNMRTQCKKTTPKILRNQPPVLT